MSYVYLKTTKKYRRQLSPKHKKIFAYVFLGLGVWLLASVLFPIVEFQIEYTGKLGQIITPLSNRYYNRDGDVLGNLSSDYSELSNWFVADSSQGKLAVDADNNVQSYTISIPTLKIENAVVAIGSQDLKKHLIQYPQTALPGQLGGPVIFGHSVLPQFFSPKSYLTIFATLYRLNPGDQILVNYDNVQYKYLVSEMFEVQPTDLSILEQRFDGKYFTMVTCSPPGTTLRRLVVRAIIADN
jgi:sortase A